MAAKQSQCHRSQTKGRIALFGECSEDGESGLKYFALAAGGCTGYGERHHPRRFLSLLLSQVESLKKSIVSVSFVCWTSFFSLFKLNVWCFVPYSRLFLGGYMQGCGAQEENLCRRSNLAEVPCRISLFLSPSSSLLLSTDTTLSVSSAFFVLLVVFFQK